MTTAKTPAASMPVRQSLVDDRLLRIAGLMSTDQLNAARSDVLLLITGDDRDALLKVTDTDLAKALASQWSPEFRRHLVATYTDNLLVAVDHAVYSQCGHNTDLPSRVSSERESAGRNRMRAGLVFAGFGALFILSNLLILPLMAGAISRYVEHPAAIAIDKLAKFLATATDGDQKNAGTKAALDAMRAMSGNVSALTSTTSQLQQSLERLGETRREIEHSDPSASPELRAVLAALKDVDTKLLQGQSPDASVVPKAEVVIAELLVALAVTAESKVSGFSVRDSMFNDVTDRFLIVPKASKGFSASVRSVENALNTLNQQYQYISERRQLVAAANKRIDEISSEDGDSGLLKNITDSITSLDQAGQALDELVTTGPELAKEAKAATQTLSSVAGFVLPYAFAVLAIGAMLVSIGVTSVLRSLRHSDEKYEELVELNKVLLLARLAAAVHGQGVPAEALIEKLARIGETTKRGEGGVPLPMARAIAEVAKALKQG